MIMSAHDNSSEILVYVGTYTRTTSEGIYVYRLDSSSGALVFSSKVSGHEEPSFLAIAPGQRYLYAVNETSDYQGESSGAVSAFSIAPETGELTFLNKQSSRGAAPCHLSVDATGRYVLAANYSGGSVAMLPIQDDGSLGAACDFVQHVGSSVADRQQGPHGHSITPSPDNRFAFAADLGLDKILIYQLDLEEGKLRPNDPPWVQIHPGAGPRHFTFHPNGRYAYAINEIDNTFTAFNFDAERGALEEIQVISTLPDDFDGTSHTADLHVHPSGKFLYGSNRGHESIVICAIDPATGQLTLVGHEPTQGEQPRNFAIDPTGKLLFAANMNTDNIVSYWIDQDSGRLDPTGQVTEVPMPVCLKMITRSSQ
jgi:6-phosphogluconolactonase